MDLFQKEYHEREETRQAAQVEQYSHAPERLTPPRNARSSLSWSPEWWRYDASREKFKNLKSSR